MSATIDRSQPIAVTFTAEQWEMVARVLSNGPYNVVAPFIGAIQAQCMRHAQPSPISMRGNGELGADEALTMQLPQS